MKESKQRHENDESRIVVGQPAPHEGQREVLTSDARTRVVAKGRRWGGTELICMDALAEEQRHDGLTAWIIYPSQRMAKVGFDRFVDRIESAEGVDAEFSRMPLGVEFPPESSISRWVHSTFSDNVLTRVVSAGSRIEFFSAAEVRAVMADRIQDESKPFPEYVAVDELDGIREKHRSDVRDLLWHKRVRRQLLVGTPMGYKEVPEGSGYEESWLAKEFDRCRGSPDRECWRFSTMESPMIPDDEVEKIRSSVQPKVAAQEYDAEWLGIDVSRQDDE